LILFDHLLGLKKPLERDDFDFLIFFAKKNQKIKIISLRPLSGEFLPDFCHFSAVASKYIKTRKMYKDQVVIIGAGIAGLSLAVQLAENKIACVVLEARHNFEGPTSGVRVSAEGVRILEKMKITNVGENTERAIMYFDNIVANFDCSKSSGKSQAIIVTRLALHEKLMEKAKSLKIEVITGFILSNAIENTEGVVVTSESGQNVTGKFLVGADGVGSKVRKLLNPNQNSSKTYAGYLGVGLITPCNDKIEMSLYHHPSNNVGVASIGKVSSSDANNNVFLWTHIHISEEEAKAMTPEMVIELIETKSQQWCVELQNLFEMCKTNSKTILAHGPVYNGKVPSKWYSDKMLLIGDAAHPYGPGGQGISMALKDSEALSEMFLSGMSDEKKATFQTIRAKEAKNFGESAEARNKPESQITSRGGIFFNGVLMKMYHFFNGGVLKSF
jgi:salicylate hydroxylase